MEVIDDLEEGSEGSNFSADEEFSDGDEVVGSATPTSSASSKSESGNNNQQLLDEVEQNIMIKGAVSRNSAKLGN